MFTRPAAGHSGRGLLLASAAMAASIQDGNFASGDLSTAWNPHGYKRAAMGTPTNPLIPKSFADLSMSNQDVNDYTTQSAVLDSVASNTPANGNLVWPANVARINNPARGGNLSSPGGDHTRASSVQQEFTVATADIDTDPVRGQNKVHVRFLGAPMLESAGHTGESLPYYFIDLVKDAGTVNEKVLYTSYNYAAQAGVQWSSVTIGGNTYAYTNWVDYDIPLDANDIQAGDKVQLRVTAAGCSATLHAGAFYLRDVRTEIESAQANTLWITAEGPTAVYSHDAGVTYTDITYTYTYTNNGTTTVNNVVVQPALPVTSNIRNLADKQRTTFVSITNPTFGVGTCTAPAGVEPVSVDTPWQASCTIGTLAPGETGTFTMTVRVPADTQADSVNNGYYPISGDSVAASTGQLVQTALLADLVPDVSKVPTSMPFGQPVPAGAQFSCTNNGSTIAIGATCNISGLPGGVTVGQCTMDGANWNGPGNVPIGKTVVCPITGTPNDPADNQPGKTVNIKVTGNSTNGSPTAGVTGNVVPVAGAGGGGGVPVGPVAAASASIPTLSEWGLITLSALMGLFVVGVGRRRML